MMIEFTRWPPELEQRYRQRGYWQDVPLGDILARHADNDDTALIDGDRTFSYRQMNQHVARLAGALQRRGITPGQTAMVQLGNVAEFYLTYFALLRAGIVPVNALFSHQRSELCAYADQIAPTLLIADRSHPLFADDRFIDDLRRRCPSLQQVILRDDAGSAPSLAQLLQEDGDPMAATPTPADQVAFFQLSGGSTGTPKLIPRTHNDYYYSIRGSVEICRVDAHTRFLCALPAAHNYPLSSPGALGVFYAGGTVVLAGDPSPTCCFPLLAQPRITLT
ncbi:AMP-binding protein, partial [Dickeya dianthicola]|uniref:AMP-binding protein n=1 Tax=Dickeya dianthicola TaxID=204039 RepID=UPI0018DF131E